MFVSYAQNGEDVILWRVFKDIVSGTYVDVGAADPTLFSVTRAFYDRGWSGINIEPAPEYATLLEEERPRDLTLRCGASDTSGEATLYVVEGTGLSTLDGGLVPVIQEQHHSVTEITVPLRTLNEILDEAGMAGREIHFLKIDVEGAEAQVLAGLDLTIWRPWVLVVEATEPMSTTQNHELWEKAVVDRGYTFCVFDGLNRFYVSEEHEDLVASLSYPVGVFDFPYRAASLDLKAAEHLRGVLENATASAAQAKDSAARAAEFENALKSTEANALADRAELSVLTGEVRDLSGELSDLRARVETAVAESLRWRNEAIRLRGEAVNVHEYVAQSGRAIAPLVARAGELEAALSASEQRLDAVAKTLSWKVTKPLRVVRRAARLKSPDRSSVEEVRLPAEPDSVTQVQVNRVPSGRNDGLTGSFWRRVDMVTSLLDQAASEPSSSFGDAIRRFEEIVESSSESPTTKAWLAMVSILGSYPDDLMLEQATRAFRRNGGIGLTELMFANLDVAARQPGTLHSELEIARHQVLIDVSHTAAHDLHTGIQRVVRESASRWLRQPDVHPVQWNFSTNSAKALSDDERDRFLNWRNHLHEAGSVVSIRGLSERNGKTLIPWKSTLLLPELVANPPMCSAYRALARSGVVTRCSLIGYDTVPMAATETVNDGMTANFAHYMSLVKHSSHLAAISESAAAEFVAFGNILASQGLSGPRISAHPLPTEPPEISDIDLAQAAEEFDLVGLPVVAVVGSHEPRKNHLVVLEAAEILWRAGHRFDLVFAGGSGWGVTAFGAYVESLAGQGFPVRVYERVSESSLWALYHLARFSVFPSLLEGYGLPIAESLASGTPVVTSAHGSMAEIAVGGGALMIDPRNISETVAAMKSLLTDDELCDRLAAEARARVWPTWDDYARSVWHDLVESTND